MMAVQTQTDDCLTIHDGGNFSLNVSSAFGMANQVRMRLGTGVCGWTNVTQNRYPRIRSNATRPLPHCHHVELVSSHVSLSTDLLEVLRVR